MNEEKKEPQSEFVESVENVENVISTNNKKKNLIIIISIAIAVLLLGGVTIWYFTREDENNIVEDSEENTIIEDEGWEVVEEKKDDTTATPVVKTIYFYEQHYGDYTYRYVTEDLSLGSDKKIGEYGCHTETCKYYNVVDNYVILEDGSTFLYNYKTEKVKAVQLDVPYTYLNLISYKNVLYGIVVSNGDELESFYSFEKEKITLAGYKGIYASDSPALTKGYIFAYKEINNSYKHYILDMNTDNVVFSISDDLPFGFSSFINNNQLYYAFATAMNDQSAILYNSNFVPLFNERVVSQYSFQDNGNIIVRDEVKNTFSIYDYTGKKISTSKEYKSVELIIKNYIVAINHDGYLVLLDSKETEIARFVKWTENLYLHTMLSGYFQPDDKPYGVYLVVEDKNIPFGTMGSGKEYYYAVDTKETGIIELEGIGGYAKPVLYLYPTKKTDVTVSFSKPSLLTTTYPKFVSNWKISVEKDGTMTDANGKKYYALYWEEMGTNPINFSKGFYVTKDNAIEFLEDKLTKIGLNYKERNEFIMYWLPILEKNEKNIVYFEFNEERDYYNRLIITPKPDSLLRLAIHIKKVDTEIKLKEQVLPTFNRDGFTAVEWGGAVH